MATGDEPGRILHDLLGVTPGEVSVAWLIDLARAHLGATRTQAGVQLIRSEPLGTRKDELSALAGLCVGTTELDATKEQS